jgi:hypothetical protein
VLGERQASTNVRILLYVSDNSITVGSKGGALRSAQGQLTVSSGSAQGQLRSEKLHLDPYLNACKEKSCK